jgi:diacylglycerol kinase family enzyme
MLVGTEKRLGGLPLGTLNHFARDLKLPPSLDDAVQIIIDGHTASIDVGEVNGVIFINNSSLGLYPSIVRKRTDVQRLGYGKWLALLWAVVSVLRRYPLLDVRLSLEGEELTHHTPFVFVGNNKYEIDRFRIGGRARLDSGELSLYLTRRTGRLGLLRLAVRALLGGLRNSDEFYSTGTKELWVETRRKKIRVAKDGEVTVMHTPLHYRVLPGALKVIVPRGEGQPAEQGG